MKNFLPAMEDLQLGEPESSSDFSEASVENAALALQESTAEGEALVSSTDEATQVATTLDAIQGHMVEANATDNGISPPVANVLNAAVEHFCTRLGAPSRRIIPAMECFGGTQSRQKATSLAIEGLKEMASKIWAAIVAAFKRMMDWLVGFFQNFQLSSKHLLARAEKLDTEAKKNTGDKKAEDAMIEQSKAESFIKHLLVDGKPAKAAEFTTLFTKLMDESKAELKTLYAGASSFSSASGEIMTTLHTGKEITAGPINKKMAGALGDITKAIAEATSHYRSTTNDSFPLAKNTRLLEHELAFGSVSKFSLLPNKNLEVLDTIAALNEFKMFIARTTGAKDPGEVSDGVPCLNSSQVQAVCTSIIENMKANLADNGVIKALSKVASNFGELNKHFLKPENVQPATEVVTKVSGCLSKVVGVYASAFIANSLRYEAAVSKSALDYGVASLKAVAA